MATPTKPIAIPRQIQIETSLTLSQSYCIGKSSKRLSISQHLIKKSGSVPKDLHKEALKHKSNLLNVEMRSIDWHRHRLTDRHLPHSIASEPNFRNHHVERDVGRDLRIISDIFHIQASGFGKGYDFASHRCASVKRSSSFPGTTPVVTQSRVEQGWSGVIPSITQENFNIVEPMDEF